MAHYSRYGHGLVEPVKKRASARSKEHHSTSHGCCPKKAPMVVIVNVICPPNFNVQAPIILTKVFLLTDCIRLYGL